MNWYLTSARKDVDDFPTTPTYEQRVIMIEGIEMCLSDPTAPQDLTEDEYDEWCEMMHLGLA